MAAYVISFSGQTPKERTAGTWRLNAKPRRSAAPPPREKPCFSPRIGAFATAHLGIDAAKQWNRWRDEATDTTLHVVVARRTRKTGMFYFSLYDQSRHHLDIAKNGWVAFGFIGSETVLLVPWHEVKQRFSVVGWPRWLPVRLDGIGRVEPFGEYALAIK